MASREGGYRPRGRPGCLRYKPALLILTAGGGRTRLEPMVSTIIGVVLALAGIGVAIYLYTRSASKQQAERLEAKVDALVRRFGQLQAYMAELPDSVGAVRAGFDAGLTAMEQSRWDEAIGHFRESVKTAAGTQLVALYNLIGLCHFTPGRRQAALEAWEESSRLARDFGDKTGEVRAVGNIGLVWHLMGKWDKAMVQFRAALALHRELGDRLGEAKDLGNIGAIWKNRCDLDKALENHAAALAIFEQLGAKREQAGVLGNIGLAWQEKGDLDKALQFQERSLGLRRELGDNRGAAIALTNIGNVWQLKGDPDRALGFHEQALAVFTQQGAKHEQASVLGNIGLAWLSRGEPARAVAYLVQARRIFTELAARVAVDQTTGRLAHCLETIGGSAFVAACVEAGITRPDAEQLAGELRKK